MRLLPLRQMGKASVPPAMATMAGETFPQLSHFLEGSGNFKLQAFCRETPNPSANAISLKILFLACRDICRDIANTPSRRDILLERMGFRPLDLDEKLSRVHGHIPG